MFRFFNTIFFILCLSFRLYYIYLICICILNVIWQFNALNGFSFQLLIYAISAIICKKKSKKKTNDLFIKRLVLFSLVYLGLLFKKKK